ncbi:hypothetical protein M5C99_15050 [Acidovorax sp. NCPPB 2350]|nr:hypothetical protein M5C99_15050 [Acidovorax sp. NCPPB 2350]
MRCSVVFLALIVLVALRGLVGPAMATQMAVGMAHGQQAAPAQGAAAQAHHGEGHGGHPAETDTGAGAGAGLPACHTAGGALSAPDCDPHTAHAPHAACADCEICHTAVITPPPAAIGAPPHGGGLRALAATRFASALPARATKPPIA